MRCLDSAVQIFGIHDHLGGGMFPGLDYKSFPRLGHGGFPGLNHRVFPVAARGARGIRPRHGNFGAGRNSANARHFVETRARPGHPNSALLIGLFRPIRTFANPRVPKFQRHFSEV